MSIFAKINSNHPVNNARVVGSTPGGKTLPIAELDYPVAGDDTRMTALASLLDTRFKHGGNTTWERPAATG